MLLQLVEETAAEDSRSRGSSRRRQRAARHFEAVGKAARSIRKDQDSEPHAEIEGEDEAAEAPADEAPEAEETVSDEQNESDSGAAAAIDAGESKNSEG